MVNKVILVGNVGRDPEMRALPSGQPVASLSLATSRRFKDRDGQRQEQTEWHNLVAFGKTAETIGQYVTKGKQLFIEGRIQTRSWDDKNTGEKKYRTEIVVEFVTFLGKAAEGSGGRSGREYEGAGQHRGGGSGGDAGGYGGAADDEDDDIPF